MLFSLWEGPSLLDGKPIAALASGVDRPSANVKTGPMVQVYIIRTDTNPIDAVRTGGDAAVCGNCSLRGDGTGKGRTCYVRLDTGLLQVYRSWAAGRVARVKCLKAFGHNRVIRLGAYGNMSAVPTHVTFDVTADALGWTGYEHLWRTCDQDLRHKLMASVESEAGRSEASALGWRTFRVRTPEQPKLRGELLCPASEESGKKVTCHTCLRCSGTAGRDTVILAHGAGRKRFPIQLEAA
jgi:hypothetical protein